MQHYVLSIEGATERQKNVKREFKKLGIVPHFFFGVQGRSLSAEALQKLCSNPTLLPGEVGCAAGHLRIFRDFLQTEESSTFIFEDDVCFSKKVTPAVLASCKKFIDQQQQGAVLLLRKKKRLGKKVWQEKNVKIYQVFRATGMVSYLINRKAMERILQVNTPI